MQGRTMSQKRVKKSRRLEELEDVFERRKEHIARTAREYLGNFLLFLVFSIGIGVYALMLDNTSMYCAVPILLIASMYYISLFLECLWILSYINKVECIDGENNRIHCTKVRSIAHAQSKFSVEIVGLILSDTNGEKYIYVLSEERRDTKAFRSDIKARYQGQIIAVECYKDSTVIKNCSEERVIL